VQVVLQRRACEQETLPGVQFAKFFGDLAVFVLNLVGLIDDNILPFELLKRTHAHANSLKGCKTDVELAGKQIVFQLMFALFFGGNQIEYFDLRTPQLELLLPVRNDRLRHDHQKVVFDLLELS